MTAKKRAIVVFPGRGSYAAPELGYLKRHHNDQAELLSTFDTIVKDNGGVPPTELDAMEKFSPPVHLPGRNASNLIFAAALSDFAAIDRDRFDVVAVCGNSLGWYLALAAAGGLSPENGAHLVDTMGHAMQSHGEGGQILYPLVDEHWQRNPARSAAVDDALAEANKVGSAFRSIELGGIAVLAGDEAGIRGLLEQLPQTDDRYPLRLPKHGAFHTPLMTNISERAKLDLPSAIFQRPSIPLVDGRGTIWSPSATSVDRLHDYTLGHQITQPYDFTASVGVALKEFAPDQVILTGPGASLGPPVAQIMIEMGWEDIADKSAFLSRQKTDPVVLSMGREDQRALTIKS